MSVTGSEKLKMVPIRSTKGLYHLSLSSGILVSALVTIWLWVFKINTVCGQYGVSYKRKQKGIVLSNRRDESSGAERSEWIIKQFLILKWNFQCCSWQTNRSCWLLLCRNWHAFTAQAALQIPRCPVIRLPCFIFLAYIISRIELVSRNITPLFFYSWHTFYRRLKWYPVIRLPCFFILGIHSIEDWNCSMTENTQLEQSLILKFWNQVMFLLVNQTRLYNFAYSIRATTPCSTSTVSVPRNFWGDFVFIF